MLPESSKNRPLSRTLIGVVIAVLVLHGLATWALLQLKVPHPAAPKLTKTTPIEIELVTLPAKDDALASVIAPESKALEEVSSEQQSGAVTVPSHNVTSHNVPSLNAPRPKEATRKSATLKKATQKEIDQKSSQATSSQISSPSVRASRKTVMSKNNPSSKTPQPPKVANPSSSNQSNLPTVSTAGAATTVKATDNALADSSTVNASSSAKPNLLNTPNTVTNNTSPPNEGALRSATHGTAITKKDRAGQEGNSKHDSIDTADSGALKEAVNQTDSTTESAKSQAAKATGPIVFDEREAQWLTSPNLSFLTANDFSTTQNVVRFRVKIIVDANGRPLAVSIVSGVRNRKTKNKIIEAIKQARLHPFIREGKAVAGTVTVTIRVNL